MEGVFTNCTLADSGLVDKLVAHAFLYGMVAALDVHKLPDGMATSRENTSDGAWYGKQGCFRRATRK